MFFQGIIIGAAAFLLIGLFHPIVIKVEYHFGSKMWSLFLIFGAILCVASINIENPILSSIIGIAGFCMLWSIHELKEQEKRVAKGWFPKKDPKMIITEKKRQETL